MVEEKKCTCMSLSLVVWMAEWRGNGGGVKYDSRSAGWDSPSFTGSGEPGS